MAKVIGKEKEVDVREEMRIALFWRGLIGDYEYIKFDPDDLMRWYIALELRGPDDIRDLMTERHASRPMPEVLGLVTKSPHPPVWIVREWLGFHETQVHTAGYWWGAAVFGLLCLMIAPTMHGCADLQPMNPLFMKPPSMGPQMANGQNQQNYGAQAPSMVPPVAFQPTVSTTGPRSTGIAGGLSGAVQATGATGAANNGASANVNSTGGTGPQ
jgi:hypothetical protein